jgi:hypothetical protein
MLPTAATDDANASRGTSRNRILNLNNIQSEWKSIFKRRMSNSFCPRATIALGTIEKTCTQPSSLLYPSHAMPAPIPSRSPSLTAQTHNAMQVILFITLQKTIHPPPPSATPCHARLQPTMTRQIAQHLHAMKNSPHRAISNTCIDCLLGYESPGG